jgi:integrase
MRLSMYRGKWAAVWTEAGQVRRRSLGTADRPTAEAAYDRFKREFTGQAATVAEALGVYCTKLIQERGGSPGAAWAAKSVSRLLGACGLGDITEERCKAYAAARHLGGVADGTIIKELGVLRAALNSVKPTHGSTFWFPAAPPPRDRRLTKPEFEQLFAGSGAQHVRLFLELLASTGARAGAISALRWRQVNLAHGLIDLQGGAAETNKRRAVVPMTKQVRRELEALHAARQPAQEDHVVLYREKPVKSIKKGFRRAVERSGLQGITPHVIRHSVACWMAEGGIPMSEIAAFLGHKDSRVTERVYAKYSPDYLRRAVAVLDRECSTVQIEQLPIGGMGSLGTQTQDIDAAAAD